MQAATNIEPEISSLHAKLKTEVENDKKQIELLKRRVAKNETLLAALAGSLTVMGGLADNIGYGAKAETIREAINSIQMARFGQIDVERAIVRLHPGILVDKARVRSFLWSLQRDGKLIRQVVPGTNKQPAQFEKVAASPATPRIVGSLITNGSVLSVPNLEEFVRQKNRRMSDVKSHFDISEAQVRTLFAPHSKVYEASRGWIKIHE